MAGDGFVVRRNLVTDTGAGALFGDATAIVATGSGGVIEENLVTMVLGNNEAFAEAAGVGIDVSAVYTVVRRNDVAGVFSGDDNDAVGIASSGTKNKLIGNTVSALSSPTGTRRGLDCEPGSDGIAIGSTVSDASSSLQAVVGCDNGGENAFH